MGTVTRFWLRSFLLLISSSFFCAAHELHDDEPGGLKVYSIALRREFFLETIYANLSVDLQQNTFKLSTTFDLGNCLWKETHPICCHPQCTGPLPETFYLNQIWRGEAFLVSADEGNVRFKIDGCSQTIGVDEAVVVALHNYWPEWIVCIAGPNLVASVDICEKARSSEEACGVPAVTSPETPVTTYEMCLDSDTHVEAILEFKELVEMQFFISPNYFGGPDSLLLNGTTCSGERGCGGTLGRYTVAGLIYDTEQYEQPLMDFRLNLDNLLEVLFALNVAQPEYVAIKEDCSMALVCEDRKPALLFILCPENPDPTSRPACNMLCFADACLNTGPRSLMLLPSNLEFNGECRTPPPALSTAATVTVTGTVGTPSTTIGAANITTTTTTATTLKPTTTPCDWCFPNGTVLPLPELANQTINSSNVDAILEATLSYADLGTDLKGSQLIFLADILVKSASLPNLKPQTTSLILKNIDGILSASETAFDKETDEAAVRILNATHLASVNADHDISFLDGSNIGFASARLREALNCSSQALVDKGDFFEHAVDPIGGGGNSDAIQMPQKFLCSGEATHSTLTIIRSRKAFVGQEYNVIKRKINPIAAMARLRNFESDGPGSVRPAPDPCDRQQYMQDEGSVFSASAIDASDPQRLRYITRTTIDGEAQTHANIRINISGNLRPLHGKYKVTWWNYNSKEWSGDEDCKITTNSDGKLIAQCTHLTDFTLLVDGLVKDPCLCDKPLMIIGYIISSLSIVCLFILVAVSAVAYFHSLRRFYLFRKVAGSTLNRRNNLTLLYNFTLFLFYLFFTLFSDQKVSGEACDVFGALTYVLLMSCIFLTIFQALKTVSLFYSDREILGKILALTRSPAVTVIVSYGAPTVLTIFLFMMTNFFQRQDQFCWIRSDYIIYGMVIPLTILILNALFCSFMVAKRLFARGESSRIMLSKHHFRQRVFTILLMQLTLGTPWVLQYLAIFAPETTAWHYLFTIINGSQGVLIFLLWLYRRWRQQKTATPVVSQTTPLGSNDSQGRHRAGTYY